MNARPVLVALPIAFSLALVGACDGTRSDTSRASETPLPSAQATTADALARSTLLEFPRPSPTEGDERFVRALGFASITDMRQSSTLPSFPVRSLPYGALRTFDPAAGADAALVTTRVRMVPVVSHGAVVSGVTVEAIDGAARVISLGHGTLLRQLAAARDAMERAGRSPDDEPCSAVEIVGLSAWFLGCRDADGKLQLVSLRDDARTPDLPAGQAASADHVLAELAPYAGPAERGLGPARL